MKKFLTLLLVNLFFAGFAMAQTCQPDEVFADSPPGVYPAPFEPTENPDGGITESACINQPYAFTFTVVVSETITLFGATFQLDSIRVDNVAGLPAGLGTSSTPFVVCNPSTCTFPSDSQGCVLIEGTATGGEITYPDMTTQSGAGDYNLVITGTAFVQGLTPQSITFPGIFAQGSYTLVLEEENSGTCLVGTNNPLEGKVGFNAVPNPTTGATVIDINSQIDGPMQFTVTDFMGKVVHQEMVNINIGENQIPLNAANLSNGIYIYSLSNELGNISKKLVVGK